MSNRAMLSTLGLLLASYWCAGGDEPAPAGGLLIAADGRSEFRIVVADGASAGTRRGAHELQRFLAEITGATLPIVSDTQAVGPHEIIVGNNAHVAQSGLSIAADRLGPEGYVLKSNDKHLVIAGGEPRGSMYGVYGLLQEHLGCRWFTPTVSRIPKQARLELPALDETRGPALEYRDTFEYECFDPDWSCRNRMNGSWKLTKEHGGSVKFGGGLFGHSAYTLLPPEKYFAEHPEYYSLVNGQRLQNWGQLCFTNEEVIKLVGDEVLRRIRSDEDGFAYSISQMDCFNYCQCPKCQELAKQEDSQMAPLLTLVNNVADRVAKEFPDRVVETLAYQWSRKPPKSLRPRPNVIIRLCSIECCFSHPLDKCDSPANLAFVEDIRNWARLCNRLWIWNYETSFRHYYRPFPNYQVWDQNTRFFVANGVKGIFTEDNYQTPVGDLDELGAYVRARLLWDPQSDARRATDEFLDGVYGKAAKPIRQYMDMLVKKVVDENIHVTIFSPSDAEYMTEDVLTRADELWSQAEAAVAGEAEVLERVRRARLSPHYAFLERAVRQSFFDTHEIDHAKFTITGLESVLAARMHVFFEVGQRAGIVTLAEGNYPLEAFRKDLESALDPAWKPVTLTPMRAVELKDAAPGLQWQYYEGEWTKLPEFAGLKPAATGAAAGVELTGRKRDDNFAMVFTGYLKAPRSGVYRLYLGSDAGSRLYIGDQAVVDNDGVHAYAERAECVGLTAGYHPVRIVYFQAKGGRRLEVSWAGPEMNRHPLDAGELFHSGQ